MTTSTSYPTAPDNTNLDAADISVGARTALTTPDIEMSTDDMQDAVEEADNELLDDYMQQLLARTHNQHGDAIAVQPVARQSVTTPAPAEPSPTERNPESAQVHVARTPVPAPETSDDVQALRELSNCNARSALNTFTKSNVIRMAWMQLTIATVSIMAAFPILFQSQTSGAWVFALGLVAFVVAIWHTTNFIRTTSSEQFSRRC